MAELSNIGVNAVGVAAGLCSMASFIPQIIKIIHERDASGVSLRMFAVTAFGFILWTAYGALQGSWPLVLSNVISLILSLAILALRLKFGDGKSRSAS